MSPHISSISLVTLWYYGPFERYSLCDQTTTTVFIVYEALQKYIFIYHK